MSRDDLPRPDGGRRARREDDVWGDDEWGDDAPAARRPGRPEERPTRTKTRSETRSARSEGRPAEPAAATRAARRSQEGRSSRRSGRGRPVGKLMVAGMLALLLGLGMAGWALLRGGGDEAACSGETLSVSVSPELAETVSDALTRVTQTDACAEYDVSAASAADVAASINEGDAPDVWIPDSSTWVDAIDSGSKGQWLEGPSVARSPIVLATSGLSKEVSSWANLLNTEGDLKMANPDVDTASRLAFHASRIGQPDSIGIRTGARLIVLSRFAAPSVNKLLNDHQGNPGETKPFPASEQAIFRFDEEHKGDKDVTPLRAVMPERGTLSLDYPWITNPELSAEQLQVAEKARSAFGTLEMRRGLEKAGFRSPDGGDGPMIDGRKGARLTELKPLSRSERLAAVDQWDILRTDMRMLPIIDVSGSMAWPSPTPGMTRFQVAQGALLKALDIIPAGSQIGGWIFSSDQGGKGIDHKEIAPIKRLDERLGNGQTQRDRLKGIVRRSDKYVKGDTGLYDSIWAGYQKMQKEYDPDYVNSVVVITDGENDDPNGGLNLRRLLDKIDGAYDSERPVRIITIGMGEANPKALQQIADESGGTSYIAETPDDIERVFVQALLARRA